MGIMYLSTRGDREKVTASMAVLRGLAPDGGLYVPERIPALPGSLSDLCAMDYRRLACEIMGLFFTDYTPEELKACAEKAYDEKFETPEIAPIRKTAGESYLELYHGQTIAFKDMALSILPHLMVTAAKKNNCANEIVILTATSGDTGKAALAGFADVPGTRIVVFYPKGGVSAFQEKQMVTQKGANVKVIGIEGNFDDAQSGVKKIFGDTGFARKLNAGGFQLSSANSINIGRLVPQIVYYVYAWTRMVASGALAEGEKLNIAVPTGNFGNILAAYYAKQMGLPVGKLICASNENKVLFDFFRTGCYDKNRPFILTSSPSMDILISSNLERLIYHICGNDPEKTRGFMELLAKEGRYEITDAMREGLADFYGNYASEEEAAAAIRHLYQSEGYVIDTHTAVAAAVCSKYRNETGDDGKILVASTASPFKFARSVAKAIGLSGLPEDDFALIDLLAEKTGMTVPRAVGEVKGAKILHGDVVSQAGMKAAVAEFLGVTE